MGSFSSSRAAGNCRKKFSGSARVTGSAGTGKTIVALHRAVSLARTHPEARVLLTTFSKPLANALQTKLRLLISSEPRLGERLEVTDMDSVGIRLHRIHCTKTALVTDVEVQNLISKASKSVPGHKFSQRFLVGEWLDVVDAWQLLTWEEYRDVRRLGRKTRLPEKQRAMLWDIFAYVRDELRQLKRITVADMFSQTALKLKSVAHPPFEFVVVDEAQDVSVPQLRFLAALGGNRANSLFFAGDLGQRIFQQPFSWKSLGVICHIKCLMKGLKWSAGMSLSAPCILPKAWSFEL